MGVVKKKLPEVSKKLVETNIQSLTGRLKLVELKTQYGQPGKPLLPLKMKLCPLTAAPVMRGRGVDGPGTVGGAASKKKRWGLLPMELVKMKLPEVSKELAATNVQSFRGRLKLVELKTQYGQPGTPLLPLKMKLCPLMAMPVMRSGGVG